jgi:hypothetical protein
MEVADVDPLESLSELEGISEAVPTPGEAKVQRESLKKQRREAAKNDVISRPVIRGADEETARMLRGSNSDKVIKRRE